MEELLPSTCVLPDDVPPYKVSPSTSRDFRFWNYEPVSHETEPQMQVIPRRWKKDIAETYQSFAKVIFENFQHDLKIRMIEREIYLLKLKLENIENSQPMIVPIDTVAPEQLEVIRPFHVVLRPMENEFVAYFHDANISTSGSTIDEAIFNIKDMIVATFESLVDRRPEELGPIPQRQIQVLKQFLRKQQ